MDAVEGLSDDVDDGSFDEPVADGGHVQDPAFTGGLFGDGNPGERVGDVGPGSEFGGEVGQVAVQVCGDGLGFPLELAVSRVLGQEGAPGLGEDLGGGDGFEEASRLGESAAFGEGGGALKREDLFSQVVAPRGAAEGRRGAGPPGRVGSCSWQVCSSTKIGRASCRERV